MTVGGDKTRPCPSVALYATLTRSPSVGLYPCCPSSVIEPPDGCSLLPRVRR